jgi:hypothetical protein
MTVFLPLAMQIVQYWHQVTYVCTYTHGFGGWLLDFWNFRDSAPRDGPIPFLQLCCYAVICEAVTASVDYITVWTSVYSTSIIVIALALCRLSDKLIKWRKKWAYSLSAWKLIEEETVTSALESNSNCKMTSSTSKTRRFSDLLLSHRDLEALIRLDWVQWHLFLSLFVPLRMYSKCLALSKQWTLASNALRLNSH